MLIIYKQSPLARMYAQADYFVSSPFPYNDCLTFIGLILVVGMLLHCPCFIGCYAVASQEPLGGASHYWDGVRVSWTFIVFALVTLVKMGMVLGCFCKGLGFFFFPFSMECEGILCRCLRCGLVFGKGFLWVLSHLVYGKSIFVYM